jgi:UDP-glucuronate decarboxylase
MIKIMRIFNTYGPRMHENDGRVVSNFIISALRGEPISIYGNGSQTRSFCYVDDLIEGALRLMSAPADLTGPVNFGNPNESTILELAKKILAMTGSSSRIVFRPASQDDPKQRRPDISLARTALDWQPRGRSRRWFEEDDRLFQNASARGYLNSRHASPANQAERQFRQPLSAFLHCR